MSLLVWKLHSLDDRIASVRYRAVLPILALKQNGVVSRLYRSLRVERFERADVVVFVKSVTVKDLILAQRVSQRGIPIVLDLCDNIFVPNYMRKFLVSPAELFQAISQYAAVITTTGPQLAAVIRARVGAHIPIIIVPDGIETDVTTRHGRRLLARARMVDWVSRWMSIGYWINGIARVGGRAWQRVIGGFARSKESLTNGTAAVPASRLHKETTNEVEKGLHAPLPPQQNQPVKTIIWFGNAGSEYSRFGLCDIVDIAEHLLKARTRVSFELLVVSNNRKAYKTLIEPLGLPSRYVEWDPQTVKGLIAQSSLAIVPNSRDEFAVCKSANRAILSLDLGVPVVATRTPALEPFQGCVVFDEWENGIVQYLTDTEFVQRHLAAAKTIVAKQYGAEVIAERWMCAIELAKNAAPRAISWRHDANSIHIVLLLHLVQDLDLALPLLNACADRGDIEIRTWVSKSLVEKSPRVLQALQSNTAPFVVVDDDSVTDIIIMGFAGVDALVTIAETNQRAHRFPHLVTRRANVAGVRTYTMQHGFENIGLTYSDSVHPISKVRCAAKTIFTWGPLNVLHQEIRSDTRAKCVSVGCTKAITGERVDISALKKTEMVVGIFENLHWHRYDQVYATRFIEDCAALAVRRPDITFVVKPHHAGRWLTSRYRGPVPDLPNLLIADPAVAPWERYTASQLMGALDAIITTPSTVALDAARMGKPVTVVGYGMDLSIYAPLPVIDEADQWDDFVTQVYTPASRAFLLRRGREYVDRVLRPGNAVERILEVISRDVGKALAEPMSLIGQECLR